MFCMPQVRFMMSGIETQRVKIFKAIYYASFKVLIIKSRKIEYQPAVVSRLINIA